MSNNLHELPKKRSIAEKGRRAVGFTIVGCYVVAFGIAGAAFILKDEPKQRHPTALDLATERGKSVSQFPAAEEGLDGDQRFCVEIGGQVLNIASDPRGINCGFGERSVVIPTPDQNSDNDQPMEEACAAANGTIEGVAVSPGNSFSVPACITDI